MAVASMPADYHYPIPIPGPSFGDSQCGMAMAGGIAAALYHRERTGRGSIVDVSLLSAGLWAAQGTNVGAWLTDHDSLPPRNRRRPPNPLATTYRTADDRFLSLGLLEGPALFCCVALMVSEPWWPLLAMLVPMGGMVAWFPHDE